MTERSLGLMQVFPFRDRSDLTGVVPVVQRCLADAGVVLLPTETFYGLACDPWSERAVGKVLDLKGRPGDMPLPVLAGDWGQVERVALVPENWRSRLEGLWPGPTTVVLPLHQAIPASPVATVAIRIPGHRLLRQLLGTTGPLTGTSANRHGIPPLVDVSGVLGALVGSPNLVLDGGTVPGGLASTLVDLSGAKARILRQGPAVWDPMEE